MKKRLTTAALLTLTMLLITTIGAFAQNPQQWQNQSRRKIVQRLRSPLAQYYKLKKMKDYLKITDEQLTEIKKIYFDLADTVLTLRTGNQKLILESKKLFDVGTPDYAALEENIKQRSMNRGKIFVERLKARKAIEKILTDEQKKTLAQVTKRWLKKTRERKDQRRMRQYQHPPKSLPSK